MAVHTERGLCSTPCAFPARQNPILSFSPPHIIYSLIHTYPGWMKEMHEASPCQVVPSKKEKNVVDYDDPP